jgi:hypothetical protein|nr:MAG TPA: hypothetical protein [Caudoviricetes sp.]
MKIKYIKNFLNCKENIIQIEISRYLLNRTSGKIPDEIFNRLWLESDVMLNKEINKLTNMLSDDVSDYETLDQLIKLVADEVTIKDIACPDDMIPVDEIVAYIKQDIVKKSAN